MLALREREAYQTPEALSQYPWVLASGMRAWVFRCVSFVKEYACPRGYSLVLRALLLIISL